MSNKYTMDDFIRIVKRLRSENGCPWDREQTNESLRANTIEETYELSEALLNNNSDEIKKELAYSVPYPLLEL